MEAPEDEVHGLLLGGRTHRDKFFRRVRGVDALIDELYLIQLEQNAIKSWDDALNTLHELGFGVGRGSDIDPGTFAILSESPEPFAFWFSDEAN